MQFYGNKVRQLSREKDTAWYEAYLDLQLSTVNFIKDRASNVCAWTGKSDGAEAFFSSISSKVMAGEFTISAPGSAAVSSPIAQPSAQPKASDSSNAANFRTAVGDAILALQTAATALAIPQVSKVSAQFIELVERSAKLLEAKSKFKQPKNIDFFFERLNKI